jgi:hypothetical protein
MNTTEIQQLTKNLLELNVNDHKESKNGLSYLSWAWACTEALKHDPSFVYEVKMFNDKPYIFDENLGYMVFTSVTMAENTKTMQLPVMDNKNQAQKHVEYTYKTTKGEYTVQPATMFDINTAIMRCLAKNLALFGLGMYIYAGEDLPEELEDPANPLTDDQKAEKKQKQAEAFKQTAITNIRR